VKTPWLAAKEKNPGEFLLIEKRDFMRLACGLISLLIYTKSLSKRITKYKHKVEK
jgi:hypothetical protein